MKNIFTVVIDFSKYKEEDDDEKEGQDTSSSEDA
jgi:hypothetical protein